MQFSLIIDIIFDFVFLIDQADYFLTNDNIKMAITGNLQVNIYIAI